MINAIGFTKKHESGTWDATLVWKHGCIESWKHPTMKAAKARALYLGKQLGIVVTEKWRKA